MQATDHGRAADGVEARGKRLADAHASALERARAEAAYAWDASPISTARMTTELWAQIKNEDWALVAESGIMSDWTARLWTFDKHYQSLGGSGGAGVGYGAPAAVGAALANKKHGRLSVTIQGDGDSCTRRASGGRRRITGFRCSR